VLSPAAKARLPDNLAPPTARTTIRPSPDAGTRQLGVLLASGLIVGESLFGVLLAGLIVVTGSGAPLALIGTGFADWAQLLGLAVFTTLAVLVYQWTEGRAAAA